jgi:hypothetical protein
MEEAMWATMHAHCSGSGHASYRRSTSFSSSQKA